ncbi:hypothetical protein BGZ89_002891 [Linnemannia elongata]|nr:hypothetical protein BGZ89_002891 [Linnemannia elongata]
MGKRRNGSALIEEMIQAIAKDYKNTAMDDGKVENRAAMLRRVEQVREQYIDRIQANPWLKEQLASVYWD